MCGNYQVPAPEQVKEILKLQMIGRKEDTGKAFALPRLHIMIYSLPAGGFESACLEFGLFAGGDSVENALRNIKAMCNDYLVTIIADRHQPQQLFDDVKKTEMEEFWGLYRFLSVMNASQGQIDIDASVIGFLTDEIGKLHKRIAELEEELKIQHAAVEPGGMFLLETDKIPIHYPNRIAPFLNAN